MSLTFARANGKPPFSPIRQGQAAVEGIQHGDSWRRVQWLLNPGVPPVRKSDYRQKTLKRTSATKQYSTRGPTFYCPDLNTRTPERLHSAPTIEFSPSSPPDGMHAKGSLKEKLEQLRHVRLKVESKVREAQEEERKRLGDQVHYQRQVFHFRQKMLVHTIKGLKRSLEDQSARLQETYRANNDDDKQDYCET
ncbi:unnamed protein product [Timema podura]|uniref:Uncharacterized protein n=1 Tax=Timema podura TaxID=61482 RepID=A0ABN7NLQ8_TIMPD|nr:unnamed protein product [Timema podura]